MNAARPSPRVDAGRSRGRRVLRALGIVLACLLLLLCIALWWALRTESGTAFVLARATSALDGRLHIARHDGTVAGPLHLEEVRYTDAASGVEASLQQLDVDLDVTALLGGRVQIRELAASGIDLALTTVAKADEDAPVENPLRAPIDILVERLALQDATIRQDGETVLVVDRLDLAGAWTQTGLLVKSLSVRSPDGSIDLNGTLATADGYSGNAKTRFDWRSGETTWAGELDSTSDGKQARLQLRLSQPMPASAAVTLGQSGDMPWTLRLDVPEFAARQVLTDTSLRTLALDLEASGNRQHGSARGHFVIDDHPLALDPLRYAIDESIVTIETLHLTSPGSAGALDIDGRLDLSGDAPEAHLKAAWTAVELPADLAGQAMTSQGELAIDGRADAYTAKGSLQLGPPDAQADIEVDIAGSAETVALNTIRLVQPGGSLDANGTLTLQPAFGWQVEATADQLNPGAFFKEWPGAVDFTLSTTGTLTAEGPQANLRLDKVGGSLRDKPLGGSADLDMRPGYLIDGNLELRSGASRLAIEGSSGTRTDARVVIDMPALGDWFPASGGSANGRFHISGQWPNLDIDGDLAAREIAWSGTRAASLELVGKVTNIEDPAGALTLRVANLARGDIRFESLLLQGEGNAASHQVSLVALGHPAGVTLAVTGGRVDERWTGQVTALELDPVARSLPDFALDEPARMSWDGSQFVLDESCLIGKPRARTDTRVAVGAATPAEDPTAISSVETEAEPSAGPAILCAAGNSQADGTMAARYRLEHLPLRMILRLAAPDSPVRMRGELSGTGELASSATGEWSGRASIRSDQGRLFYSGGTTPLLSYTGFAIETTLEGNTSNTRIHADLDHDGLLDGNLRMIRSDTASPAIEGNLDLDLNSLAFLELVSSEIAGATGKLTARYGFSGTLDQPRLQGALNLQDFATDVPSAGLRLTDGALSLRAVDADTYALEGSITSGSGQLVISGSGGIGSESPAKLTIKGTDFVASDIPAARVVLSPDLVVERKDAGWLVSGDVVIPAANVDLAKLPGGGASAASPDVIIIDAEQPEPGKPMPIDARVTVTLGDDVKLAGYGFDGTLSGNLRVIERPGRATTGSGTLIAAGTYKAYGQDLKIETGRVLFAGTAIDNPGIDIRAVREIRADDVTAGLQVRGTAQVPVLTVFSDPAMEQSEALSYLVTGKPLASLKSGEGDMLGTAARALGTAGGDLLAKRIGSRLGVDDIGVADSGALGGAAFTVGKYLSPKLYLSYGVGIFDPGEVVTLRYLFNRRWNFEAQNATTGSRAGFNYRIEK